MANVSPSRFHGRFSEPHESRGDDVTPAHDDRDFAVVVLLALLGIALSAAALNSGVTAPDLSDIAAFLG